MLVHQVNLRHRSRPQESGFLVEVGTSLHATAAGHAPRQWINFLLLGPRHAGARSEIRRGVDGNPGLHFLQIIEHFLSIDHQIPHDREFAERRKPNRLGYAVHQTGTGLARFAVDQHGASAADFLQTIALPHHRFCHFAVLCHRIFLHRHQGGDHVHAQGPGYYEFFGVRF